MMKFLVLAIVASMVIGCEKTNSNNTTQKTIQKITPAPSSECKADTTITGLEFRPLRKADLYVSRSLTGQKVINEKATKLLGEVNYKMVDGSTRVIEECTVGGAAFVRIIDPEWLKNDKGWVSESVLKQKKDPSDKYEGLITEYAYEALPADYFKGNNSKLKPVSKEILKYQIAAAKTAIDSGSCDYVEGVLFLAKKSTVKNYNYIVDCSNKKRFELNSDDLKAADFKAVSNNDRAVGQSRALEMCKDLIAGKVVNPSTLNFNEILDMSYYKAEITGNVRLSLGFEAKNKLGQAQGYKAVCIFSPSGENEITISLK